MLWRRSQTGRKGRRLQKQLVRRSVRHQRGLRTGLLIVLVLAFVLLPNRSGVPGPQPRQDLVEGPGLMADQVSTTGQGWQRTQGPTTPAMSRQCVKSAGKVPGQLPLGMPSAGTVGTSTESCLALRAFLCDEERVLPFWCKKSGGFMQAGFGYELEVLARVMEQEACVGGLNLKKFGTTKSLLCCEQLAESASLENPEQPSSDGARLLPRMPDRIEGAFISQQPQIHSTFEKSKEASILMEKRKTREARAAGPKAKAKGKGQGGKGGPDGE